MLGWQRLKVFYKSVKRFLKFFTDFKVHSTKNEGKLVAAERFD